MSLSPVQFRLVTLNQYGGKSLWEGKDIAYQVTGFKVLRGFDSRCHRFHQAAFDYWLGRLLLRQQEGDRYSYAVLASAEAFKWRGRFCWQNCLAFIQESAGSIPAHVTASNRNTRKSPGRMRTLS